MINNLNRRYFPVDTGDESILNFYAAIFNNVPGINYYPAGLVVNSLATWLGGYDFSNCHAKDLVYNKL